MFVVIIVSFKKILYCHNILKLPDTKRCSRQSFPVHCSLSARKLFRLFNHHKIFFPPHSLKGLGSSPVYLSIILRAEILWTDSGTAGEGSVYRDASTIIWEHRAVQNYAKRMPASQVIRSHEQPVIVKNHV
jgi:hypothetical protein